MFSYRHSYHAGNFADVVKHVILVALIEALQRKDAPLCILDTHAGIGQYDLQRAESQQTGEFRDGIARLWEEGGVPPPVERYLALVRAINPDGLLRFYPGSPRLARQLLRPQDRLQLGELNPSDHARLVREFANDPQVIVHLQDAYQSIKALLPPKEKRGLILIDPAFERKDEYQRLVTGLREGLRRFANGVYAIWYPLLSAPLRQRFHDEMIATGIRKILRVELSLAPLGTDMRMVGSGMLIINPPWQIESALNEALGWLHTRLAPTGLGGVDIDWLVPE